MAVITAQGIATPFDKDGESYPASGSRLPSLRSFRLIYPVNVTQKYKCRTLLLNAKKIAALKYK
jgi:hypothetical protein